MLSSAKITKARGKVKAVKPILKKLSHSEKNSLDLDEGWDQRQIDQMEGDGGRDDGFAGGGSSFYYSGQARDVTFLPAAETRGAGRFAQHGHGPGHGRSGSQASAGSGTRGPFVHPFAQTPRTSTPPRSYANSVASVDNARDCSPTITERDDDDDCFDSGPSYLHSHPQHSHNPSSSSRSDLRRPSLNSSQRTTSFPDASGSKPPSLRINTNRSISGTTATSSRFAHGNFPTANSASDLAHDPHNLSVSLSGTLDSPTGSIGTGSLQQPPAPSHSSPLRTSLDMGAFPRLRAKSEMDTATRVETIRAARRKFEERERAKEEKYDREMIKKRERRDTKEAARIERGEDPNKARKKKTPTGLSTVSEPGPVNRGRLLAHAGIGRRRHTEADGGISSSLQTTSTGFSEKDADFAARPYESSSMAWASPPEFGATADDVHFEQAPPRRGSSAKRKTQSYWQGFLLWLRTKLLRLSTR